MSDTRMACGHTAQAVDGTDAPVCGICIGITPDARVVVTEKSDLTGRMARCSYSRPGESVHRPAQQGRGYLAAERQPVPSSYSLPFFAHRPDRAEDSYYCGCWGWD